MAAILDATYPDLYAAVGVHSGLAPGTANKGTFLTEEIGGSYRRYYFTGTAIPPFIRATVTVF